MEDKGNRLLSQSLDEGITPLVEPEKQTINNKWKKTKNTTHS